MPKSQRDCEPVWLQKLTTELAEKAFCSFAFYLLAELSAYQLQELTTELPKRTKQTLVHTAKIQSNTILPQMNILTEVNKAYNTIVKRC